MKSILDPTFQYRDSASTDLRETFKRVRREQKRAQRARSLPVVSRHARLLPVVISK